MEDIETGNPKTRFMLWLFKPGVDWLEARGISGFFLVTAFLGVVMYFVVFLYREKDQKLAVRHWMLIISFVMVLCFSIFFQIEMFIGHPLLGQ